MRGWPRACSFPHMCAGKHVCVCGGRRRQSAGLYLISSSSKTPTLRPHFLRPLAFPPALTESKQTIRGDYYEEEKRNGFASRSPKSLGGFLFGWIRGGGGYAQDLMMTALFWFKSLTAS